VQGIKDIMQGMIIYGDILFLENFITGCVLLYMTAVINKIVLHDMKTLIRIIIGGSMCGAFSLLIFLYLSSLLLVVIQVVFAFVVCAVSLGKHCLLRKSISFVLITYFAGGIIMALQLLLQQDCLYSPAGIYTEKMKSVLLVIYMAMCVVTVRQIVSTVSKIKLNDKYTVNVTIICEEKRIDVRAYIDSANCLTDPISGRGVAVSSAVLWEKLRAFEIVGDNRKRLIPYETVGVKGILQAVRVDAIAVSNVEYKNCIVAENNQSFKLKNEEGYEVELLLPRNMMGEGRVKC
jgi:sigma-E processing peptidase SpoIIGA